ncbi:hypothetical protein GCM10008904_10120 [Paraclostridium ghonii]|uniref:Phage minor structural protein n=1 Tax=Paraclostridium ghonii TaxID=29358 RepID=A0ABU0MYH0_9FIRM|nr:phage tail spike protein [Paeniclostridium ghonii]MDQ0555959.1 phage minor structural protein [Paeniclostridium ghonii]
MLYILNKQEQIISTLSNKGDMNKVVPYFEDIHIEELDTGVETFEFKTISNSKASNSIQIGNYVAFKDKEHYKIFQIREVKEVHTEQVEKYVYCESACLELLNEVIRPMEINSANLNQFLKTILEGTSWSIGMLDASLNEVIPVDLSGYDNVYKVIQDVVIGKFGGEIRFRVEIANNRIIAKYIDVFAKRGRVTKHRFEYGVNMTSVEKIVDSSELVTALIGLGKDDITFKEVESDDKPKNQDFIINEDAYNRWNNKGSHIMGVFNCESESPQELLKLTREELKRRSNPKITYNLEVELLGEDVDLGDEVFVIDNEFNPPLYLSARVNKLERSKTDSQINRCTLANFKEVKSSITSEMRALADGLEGKLDDKINQKFPIGNDDIQNDAITSDKIKDNQVYGSHIFANQITADHIDADQIKAKHIDTDAIKSKHIDADQIQSEHIDANQITAKHLSSSSIKAEHIDANQITAKHLSANSILAGSTVIGQGAIGSAQISELSASKISSGTIDTSNIDIQGENGMLKLKGNRLQVFTGSGNQRFERVSLGDVNNDSSYYGLLVRGSDGNTVLFDEKGITEKGITDGLITNEHISGDTQIDGSKLDISSVIREINDDTEKITGHAISVEGSTLSTKLTQIENKQNDNGKAIESNTTQIKANEKSINLKVDTQTYTEDKNNMTSSINKNTSDISQLNNEIKLKVEQTDINTAIDNLQIGGTNLSQYTSFELNNVAEKWMTSNPVNSSLFIDVYDGFGNNLLTDAFIKGKNVLRQRIDIEKMVASGGAYDYINLRYDNDRVLTLEPNTEYTLSFWAYKGDNTQGLWGAVLKVNDNGSIGSEIGRTEEYTKYTGGFTYHEVTFTTDVTVKYFVRLYNRHKATLTKGNADVYWYNIKLEKGNKATEWSVCPLDIRTEITNVKTEVTTNLDGFKTEVSKNYYTKNDVDNKGYQTSSQVQQTVDGLKVKFEESGGYNLLKNYSFYNGLAHWDNWGSCKYEFDTHDNGKKYIRLDPSSNNQGISQTVYGLTVGKKYTLSCMVDFNPNCIGGIQVYNGGEYPYKSGISDSGQYVEKLKLSFTAKDVYCIVQVGVGGWANSFGPIKFWDIQLEEGEIATSATPNPDEVYSGITSIDKDGITVRNSNSNTCTQIDSSSFSVNDNNGGTIAEFAQNSNIPNLISGTINSGYIYANNIVNKTHTNTGELIYYYVDGISGNDNNDGSLSKPFKTVQKAIDCIPNMLNVHYQISISGPVPGFNLVGRCGAGVIRFLLESNAVINDVCSFDGCTNKINIRGTDKKGTFKSSLYAFRCSYIEIYNVCWRGHDGGGANIQLYEGCFAIVDMCDIGHSWCGISNVTSTLHVRNNIGSELDWYVSCGLFSKTYFKSSQADYVPDSKFGLTTGNGDDGTAYVHKGTDVNFIKKPSDGWDPIYKPTQRVSTWNFNKIWSEETLNGWGTRNELIQGYYSGWSTGRWTGYMQMADSFNEIQNTISGGTNLSGRIYIQRRTSSGNSTGSKLCLYASDGTTITTSTNIDQGQGVWVNLNSSIISKIQSGAIKYFYLKADSNNAATYFKCESNAKIEITYTK